MHFTWVAGPTFMPALGLLALIAAIAVALFCGVLSAPASALPTSLCWDTNGSDAGAGATPNGAWGIDNFWSGSSTGVHSTGARVVGRTAVFSAGSDAVNAVFVNFNGTQSIRGFRFEEGNVRFSGGTILLTPVIRGG